MVWYSAGVASWLRRGMHALLIILVGLAVAALYLRWREPALIFYPEREFDDAPDRHDWAFADVWLTAADGVRLHGWFLPAPAAAGAAPATILFFHGNAGNISHRFDKLAILRELGVNVLIIDYRGYGRSDGRPGETGTYLDAQAAYDHLRTARNCDPRRILLYGESLGAAIAVDLATRVPVGGVILEEPFTSIADVGQGLFPFLPVRWLVRHKYDSLAKISRLNAPLLLFHSRQDEFFSIRHAERLLAAAPDPKQLIELQGGHNDAFLVSRDVYEEGLREFLSRR